MPFSAAESLAMYYQQQFPDSVIADCDNFPKQDVLCGCLLYYLEEKLVHR